MRKFLLLAFSSPAALVPGEILYETDFDSFPVGPNEWTSAPEWASNDNSSGAQAIDDDVLPALLNTASLGFARPAATFTTVTLNLGFDPVETGNPILEIDTLVGIEDSTNGRRDDFFLTCYDSSGNRLASIRFDNEDPAATDTQFGIWREDSSTQFDTLVDFIPGELFNLFVTINLENNSWSADLGGIPLFDQAEFTDRTGPPNLGFLAFEWDLASPTTLGHGDNFLLVADLIVRNVTEAPTPVVSASSNPDGKLSLSWETAVGWTDQVQFSTDLISWDNSLPDATFGNIDAPSTVTFVDPGADPTRYYRVLRRADP